MARRPFRIIIRGLLALVALIAVALVALALLLRHPMPTGTPGPEADALARRIAAAVGDDAWKRTGAVRFSFGGRNHYLWDRTRELARVRFGDVEVLLDPNAKRGRATRGGAAVEGAAGQKLVDSAWRRFINDTFWLHPFGKLFDPGVTRALITDERGKPALLVTFSSGGATPGDSYAIFVDDDGLPRAWRMWVSVLPVGGLQTSWEEWVTLPTGAKAATRHAVGSYGKTLIEDLAAAPTLGELAPGPDPFAGLK